MIRQKGESQNGGNKKINYGKCSEKRTFLTHWYAHVRIRGLKMFVFRKVWRALSLFEIRPFTFLPTDETLAWEAIANIFFCSRNFVIRDRKLLIQKASTSRKLSLNCVNCWWMLETMIRSNIMELIVILFFEKYYKNFGKQLWWSLFY